MPVTHGVAGSSPVQTAKLGKAFRYTERFFAQNSIGMMLLFAGSTFKIVVLFRLV